VQNVTSWQCDVTRMVPNRERRLQPVNEVTTVSSIWTLSPFMTGVANIGTSTNNTTGLVNACATINKIGNIAPGALPGASLPSGATLPASEIDTLANILAACVNAR
jgi:hypothetical protein